MSDEELLVFKSQCARGHVMFSTLFLLFTLIQIMSRNSMYGVSAVIFAGVLIVIDVVIDVFALYKYKVLWIVLKIATVILTTIGLLGTIVTLTSVFMAVILMMSVIEIIVVSDLTDVYTRTLVVMATAIPAVIYMIINLVSSPNDQNEFFGMLCTYLVILCFVLVFTGILSHIVTSTDRKVFDLRRLSENLRRANEELRVQQEKVKRANEELGIQKIKLEAAYDKINNANAETTIQNMILKYISSSIEINTLMNLITESLLEAFGLDVCAVVIQPQVAGNQSCMCQIRTRLKQSVEDHIKTSVEQGSLLPYLNADENYIDNHVKSNTYPFLPDNAINSLLIVPLEREHVIIGALVLGRSMSEFFKDNIMFFENVVVQLQVAIYNASLYARVQQMAVRDSLTGIYNRGQLNLILDQYSKTAVEKQSDLTIALFDIDRFKTINDTYGHLFGDEVIKGIAHLMQKTADQYSGIAARYGGEEFVLVLPDRSLHECSEIITRLKKQIGEIGFLCEGQIVYAKVSVGITSYPETCVHITELLSRADNAMYSSKEHGRDRISIDKKE